MRRIMIAACLLTCGCHAEPALPPREAPAPALPKIATLEIGKECLIFDSDRSRSKVMFWINDHRDFKPLPVGTRALYLGELPPHRKDDEPEARIRIADGELSGVVGFVPLSVVKPL